MFTALSPAPETVPGATPPPNTHMPQVCCAPRYSPAHRGGLLQVSSLEGVYLRPPIPDPVGSTQGPPLPSFLGFTASQMGDTHASHVYLQTFRTCLMCPFIIPVPSSTISEPTCPGRHTGTCPVVVVTHAASFTHSTHTRSAPVVCQELFQAMGTQL